MNKSRFLVYVLIGLLSTSVAAFGAAKKKPSPPPQNQAPTITAVSADTVTVTEHNAARTFTVNQFTEINVNGRKATIADLKPGMNASITIATDSTKLSRINATSK
jgi:hypothetical protein